MRKPSLIASLVLIAGLGALGPVAQAVEKTADALEHSPSNGRRLVENDRVPADYQRADRAMKDWNRRNSSNRQTSSNGCRSTTSTC